MICQSIAYICEFEAVVFDDTRTFRSVSTRGGATFFMGNFWDISRVSLVRRRTRKECVMLF